MNYDCNKPISVTREKDVATTSPRFNDLTYLRLPRLALGRFISLNCSTAPFVSGRGHCQVGLHIATFCLQHPLFLKWFPLQSNVHGNPASLLFTLAQQNRLNTHGGESYVTACRRIARWRDGVVAPVPRFSCLRSREEDC
jgi:hypothetical protein